MKKKGVIVLIILLLVIAIIAGIILYNSHKTNYVKVDKFSMCKIINTLDEEVDNYETNKLPFTIEVADNTEVTVNGEKYQEGKRLYKVGEYDIKIKNDEKYRKARRK
jgi:flagellar basal body-associated protein FliL